jgi:hypothetical protein
MRSALLEQIRPGEPSAGHLQSQKLLGWAPQVSLSGGLSQTIAWQRGFAAAHP